MYALHRNRANRSGMMHRYRDVPGCTPSSPVSGIPQQWSAAHPSGNRNAPGVPDAMPPVVRVLRASACDALRAMLYLSFPYFGLYAPSNEVSAESYLCCLKQLSGQHVILDPGAVHKNIVRPATGILRKKGLDIMENRLHIWHQIIPSYLTDPFLRFPDEYTCSPV